MALSIREHIGAGLVAAAVIAAAMAQGLFEPAGYAAASIVVWALVLGGIVSGRLPTTPRHRAGGCGRHLSRPARPPVRRLDRVGQRPGTSVRGGGPGVVLSGHLHARRLHRGLGRARSQWLAGLTVGLAAVTVVALLAYLQPGLIGSQSHDVPNAAGRLSYPIGYWNGAGALFAGAAVLFAYGGARAPARLLRSAATAAIPLAVLGIWLAHSRGAGLALLLGWAVLVGASADRVRLLRGDRVWLCRGSRPGPSRNGDACPDERHHRLGEPDRRRPSLGGMHRRRRDRLAGRVVGRWVESQAPGHQVRRRSRRRPRRGRCSRRVDRRQPDRALQRLQTATRCGHRRCRRGGRPQLQREMAVLGLRRRRARVKPGRRGGCRRIRALVEPASEGAALCAESPFVAAAGGRRARHSRIAALPWIRGGGDPRGGPPSERRPRWGRGNPGGRGRHRRRQCGRRLDLADPGRLWAGGRLCRAAHRVGALRSGEKRPLARVRHGGRGVDCDHRERRCGLDPYRA